jgi:hypothetical protein
MVKQRLLELANNYFKVTTQGLWEHEQELTLCQRLESLGEF